MLHEEQKPMDKKPLWWVTGRLFTCVEFIDTMQEPSDSLCAAPMSPNLQSQQLQQQMLLVFHQAGVLESFHLQADVFISFATAVE